MPKFSVVWEYEIEAETPALAVTIARDRMLDPDEKPAVDVCPVVYVEEADDHIPDCSHGWCAKFFKGGVRPSLVFPWKRSLWNRETGKFERG
jgi:hypothetical protein